MQQFQPGDVVRFDVEFRNRTRQYADPEELSAVVMTSSGSERRDDVQRLATGRYYLDVTFADAGAATVRFEAVLDGVQLRPQFQAMVEEPRVQAPSAERVAMMDELTMAGIEVGPSASDAFIGAAFEELKRRRSDELRTNHARAQRARPYRSMP